MSVFNIRCIALICFAFFIYAGLSRAGQATVTINYTGFQACGGCTVCGSDYWCLATTSSWCGNTASCETKSFSDPVPGGNIITAIEFKFYSAHCSTSIVSPTINSVTFNDYFENGTTCPCSNNPCAETLPVVKNFSCVNGMPNYNYGGNNSFKICANSSFCLSRVDIKITYDIPGNLEPGQPDTVEGDLNPCSQTVQNYSLDSAANASYYVWSLPPGWEILSGDSGSSINVKTGGSGSVCVSGANNCGISAQKCVQVNTTPVPQIIIDSVPPLCINDTLLLLNVNNADGVWSGNGISDTVNGIFDPVAAGAGNHVITYSKDSLGCTNRDSIEIFVSEIPDAEIYSEDTSICLNGNFLELFSNQDGGKWEGNGITDENSGMFFPGIAGTGIHAVTYTQHSIACDLTVRDTVFIRVDTLPDPTITPAGPFCLNDPAFVMTAAADSGTWLGQGIIDTEGGIFQPGSADTGTHYISFNAVSGACTAKDSIQVEVNALPQALIVAIGDTTFCEGDSLMLDAKPAEEYLWSNGDITENTMIYESGSYYVIVSDSNSCSDTSAGINVEVYPNPSPSISNNGGFLTSSLANGNQWFLNGSLIPGADSSTYSASTDGEYYVVVTDSNGCSSESNHLMLILSAIAEHYSEKVYVIPNPSNGRFFLSLSKIPQSTSEIRIYNILGEIVHQSIVLQNPVPIDLSFIKMSGIYYLYVLTDRESLSRTIVIK